MQGDAKKPFLKEFLSFLKEYKVVSLAIAFVMGEASTGLVNSFVKDVFLPIMAPLLSAESWREAVIQIGPITISYGSFLADVINFLILAAIVFIVAKKIIKEEGSAKK